MEPKESTNMKRAKVSFHVYVNLTDDPIDYTEDRDVAIELAEEQLTAEGCMDIDVDFFEEE
jgi:hypothetical protein